MKLDPIHHIQLAFANDFTVEKNGYLHCKTTPFYIFAQAYEGHYELSAGTRSAVCEEGGAFFAPPDVPLRIRHYVNPKTGRMRVRFLHFMISDGIGFDPFSSRILPLAVSAADSKTPARLIQQMLRPQPPFRTESLVLETVSRLYALTEENKDSRNIPEWIQSICNQIRIEAANPVPLTNILKHCGYSRSKFYADFLHFIGVPPCIYIRNERIRFAARMLLQKREAGIKEIADLCGWKTPYHFSRAFKKVLGTSPRDYRLTAPFRETSIS